MKALVDNPASMMYGFRDSETMLGRGSGATLGYFLEFGLERCWTMKSGCSILRISTPNCIESPMRIMQLTELLDSTVFQKTLAWRVCGCLDQLI